MQEDLEVHRRFCMRLGEGHQAPFGHEVTTSTRAPGHPFAAAACSPAQPRARVPRRVRLPGKVAERDTRTEYGVQKSEISPAYRRTKAFLF